LIEAGRLTIDPVMVRTKSGDMRQTVVSATVVEFDDRKCMLSSTATVDGRQVASDTHEADSGLSLARCRQIDEIREIIEGMSNQQNEDSRSLSEKIEENLNKNILPFVTKLKAEKLNDNAQTYLASIENGLNTLSSFLHRNDTFSHIGLTPNETRVAKLVQHGKTSKEIASMLNVSLSAVSFHRNNIRKKIGISQSKIALADFLNSR
jgi:DNA-binding CsgD family transcriptional regulator